MKVTIKIDTIKPSEILFASTSEQGYEMSRVILIERVDEKYDTHYIVLEGSHCSCNDFYDLEWEGIEYTMEELKALPLDYGIEDRELKEFIKRYFS